MFVIPKCCGNEHALINIQKCRFRTNEICILCVLSFKQKLTKQLTFVHFNHIVDDYLIYWTIQIKSLDS